MKNVIINRNYYNTNKIIALRIEGKLLADYDKLKASRMIQKDSILLRPIVRIGLVGANWLEEKGLLSLNDLKLTKILAGLSLGEKAELLELLKAELQV